MPSLRIGGALFLALFFASNSVALAAAIPPRPGSVEALSYCAHWYQRDGNACIGDASAGSQVAVVWDDASSMQTAITRCKIAGCKISFYCEAMYTGAQRCDIGGIAATYARLVQSHGPNLFLPMLEIDALRDIPRARAISLAQAMKAQGLSLVLKNWSAVSEIGKEVPIARVVYEDLVNNTEFAREFKQLAASNPTLLLTGIVHEGGYDGDAGATSAQAMARFREYESFKNVELFYGRPTSYSRVKAYDGSMQAISAGVGGGSGIGTGQAISPLAGLMARSAAPALLNPLSSYYAPVSPSSPLAANTPSSISNFVAGAFGTPVDAGKPVASPSQQDATTASGSVSRTDIAPVIAPIIVPGGRVVLGGDKAVSHATSVRSNGATEGAFTSGATFTSPDFSSVDTGTGIAERIARIMREVQRVVTQVLSFLGASR